MIPTNRFCGAYLSFEKGNMDTRLLGSNTFKFREGVSATVHANAAEITFGDHRCTFEIPEIDAIADCACFKFSNKAD